MLLGCIKPGSCQRCEYLGNTVAASGLNHLLQRDVLG